MSINECLLIVLGTAFANNLVLVQLLGVWPFISATEKPYSAMGIGVTTIAVMTLSSIATYGMDHWILAPLHLEYLRTLLFVLVIMAVVQSVKIVAQKKLPLLAHTLDDFLPLVVFNSAVLGALLMGVTPLNSIHTLSLVASVSYSLGGSLGFALALILFSSLRERLAVADVPAPFKGIAINLIATGFIALAFMGFAGLTVNP